MIWLFVLLWPLLGIKPEGLEVATTFSVWWKIAAGCSFLLVLRQLNSIGAFNFFTKPMGAAAGGVQKAASSVPFALWAFAILAFACAYPHLFGRYAQDVAINCMIYICLGLGLNIVVGLAGMLDLGYIAFYGLGAYTYALLSVSYKLAFWICLPISAAVAGLGACIIGYCSMRMRGDYLAIVTLGFAEIVRMVFNNWMSLTNGPNGITGIKAPGIYWPDFANGFTLEHLWLKKLSLIYYVILALVVFTIIAVYRLNHSRIGRAWEAIREDETAAEVMGIPTFYMKLLAYCSGACFGGMAGAFYAARMRFVSPESFTFLESAMVLSMVVLGGMGSIPGVILGALALIALPEIFRDFELYRMLVFGGVMTLMMLFRPQGLLPPKRTMKAEKD
ncbi:branched-chain amino acid ABC transporter permease [Desulfovibrio sp. JC010]|uniref:ABC transporter permease subunit n=1 Tax=Desulfovibrio sp. JC010 TaxID=2593641 RepID=UPI0013D1EC26|nr:branched-chain amino acid ABC transporter permease [Desulfovibrio sp. JC010]NDV25885.1 branched-chain amino acid ABC transporter permease [Desulfovibrio sp. JC010]